jgi:hypothetical protein
MAKRIGIEWYMKSVAIVVALSIVFFSAFGWSDVQYYKIPTPPKEPDKGQVTTPEKPAQAKPTEAKPQKVKPVQTDLKKDRPRVSTPDKTASPKGKPPKSVGTKQPTPRGPYITSLQIGSFKTLDQARKEKSRLKALGIDGFIRHEKARGKGMWYRVYIGKFNSKRQALDYEKELKRKGIIHWSWIKRLRATPSKAPVAPTAAAKPDPAAKAVPSQTSGKKIDRKRPRFKPPTKPATKPVAKTAPEKTKPKRPVVSKKTKPRTPPPTKTTKKTVSKEKKERPGRFSLGPRAGVLYAPGLSDFRITRTVGSNTEHWEFEDLKPLVGVAIGWRFSDHWSVDAVVERVVMADIKMQYLTLGPKMHFSDSGTVRTYLRAALIHGSMEWEKAPGDFDSSMGAEAGFGIDFIGSSFSFELEAAYRHIAFDYNPPSGTDVTATDSQIDFSGFTLTGCARAHF